MSDFSAWLLGSPGTLPQGQCFSWQPSLIWLSASADLVFAVACITIAIRLLRRPDYPTPARSLLGFLAAFAVACALDHSLDALTLWQPMHGLSALTKATSAVIAVLALIQGWPLLPQALAQPSHADMEQANRELQQEIQRRLEVEAALRQQQADLAEAQRIARAGSWEWLVGTEVIHWSDEMYRITGRNPALGAPSYSERKRLYSPDNWQRIQSAVETSVTTGKPYKLDVELQREDGGTVWTTARGEVERDSAGKVVKLRGTIQDISERKSLEQERTDHAQRLADRSFSLVAVQEEERRRLSAELHDRTSPNLAAIKLNLTLIADKLPPGISDSLANPLEDTRALLDDTAASIREISADLRPPILDYAGLQPALEGYVRQVAERSGTDIHLICTQLQALRSEPVVETQLFRIVQEALTNCIKHAKAEHISINLAHDTYQTLLTIADNGMGFKDQELGQPDHAPGFGLITMRERAEFVGGSLHIESRPGHGTWITVEIPA